MTTTRDSDNMLPDESFFTLVQLSKTRLQSGLKALLLTTKPIN